MNQSELIAVKKYLNTLVEESGTILRSYPKGEFGLVADSSKDAGYYKAKSIFDRDFAALRRFNTRYASQLKKVAIAERYAHLPKREVR